MNRECCGDFFPTLGKYRCLGDGTFVEMAALVEDCPNCERKISAHTHNRAMTRKLIVTEVFIDPIGWIEMEHKEAA
jgi:hypothetical protein